MLTNNTATPAPSTPASAELDPVTAQYVADAVRALRRLDHHLGGIAPAERKPLRVRALDTSLGGVRQMVAGAISYGRTEEEAQ